MTDYFPGVGGDDGYWRRAGSPPGIPGFDNTDTFLRVYNATGVAGNFGLVYSWLRIPNLTETECDVAQLWGVESPSDASIPLGFIAQCDDVDNAVAPTTAIDANTKWNTSLTTATAPLDVSFPTSGYNLLADVTGPVQEIFARGGWASGNAMMFFFSRASDGQVPILQQNIQTFESANPMFLAIDPPPSASSGLYPQDGLSTRPHF